MAVYNVTPRLAAEVVGVSVNTLSDWRYRDDRRLSWVKRDSRIFYCMDELVEYASTGTKYGVN